MNLTRRHPFGKLAGLAVLALTALTGPAALTLSLFAAVLALAAVQPGVRVRAVLMAAVPIAAFGGLLTALLAGVPSGVQLAGRLALLTGSGVLFGLVTPAYDLMTAAARARLDPRLGYLLAAAVALLPRMRDRATELLAAQQARGLRVQGGPLRRLRVLVGVIGPLLLSVLAENDERAAALHSRGFPDTEPRGHDSGLSATGLTVRYDGPPVLAAVDLDVPAGAHLAVYGGSGAGKTTLARALAGVELPGTVTGTVQRPGRVGVVGTSPALQRSGVAPDVAAELGFGLTYAGLGPAEQRERIQAVAAQLGLTPLLERHPDRLSGGEQQRVALGSVLALRPGAVLLDDADALLDVQGRQQLGSALDTLDGAAVVTVSSRFTGVPGVLLEHGRLVGPADATTAVRAGVRVRGVRPEPGPTIDLPQEGGPPTVTLAGVGVAGILHNLDLELSAGTALGVAGPNGAGKTTLARLLNGLQRPTAGLVRHGDRDIAGTPVAELARTVGFVFADPDRQLVARTVAAEVAFGPRALGLADVGGRVDACLRAVGLADRADAHPYELSFAGRKLLALAAVLASGPPVVVLDEPTATLDQPGHERVEAILAALGARGRTVVLISHDPDLLTTHTDRVVRLQRRHDDTRG